MACKRSLYSRLLNQATDSTPTPQAVNYVFSEVHRRHVLTLNFQFYSRKQIICIDELSVFCSALARITRHNKRICPSPPPRIMPLVYKTGNQIDPSVCQSRTLFSSAIRVPLFHDNNIYICS